MKITKDKINEAKEIIIKGKEKCFSDSDWNWAIELLKQAFEEGYDLIK